MTTLDEPLPADLAFVAARYPGWTFGECVAEAASGPSGPRRVWARRGTTRLVDSRPDGLAGQLSVADRRPAGR